MDSSDEIKVPVLEYISGNNDLSFGSRLAYGVGSMYLFGLSLGGMCGLVEGYGNLGATTPRLTLNYMVNAGTKQGSFLGNNFGCLALMYNVIHGGYLLQTGEKETWKTKTGSAMLTGFLFRISRGLRSGVRGLIVAGLFVNGMDWVKANVRYK